MKFVNASTAEHKRALRSSPVLSPEHGSVEPLSSAELVPPQFGGGVFRLPVSWLRALVDQDNLYI